LAKRSGNSEDLHGVSRREFLKKSGILIGGAALASMPIFSACGNAKTISLTSSTATTLVETIPATTVTMTNYTTTPAVFTTTAASVTSPVPTMSGSNPFDGTVILGRPAADFMAVNLLASAATEVYVAYGKTSGATGGQTDVFSLLPGQPLEIELSGLAADTQYYYRVCHKGPGEQDFSALAEAAFHTQRFSGSTFNFGIQGDSHPERTKSMFNPDLYRITMDNVKAHHPDFYFLLGDDFSVDPMINNNQLSPQAVNGLYSNQRTYLSVVGSSSPIFLVNGNHDQAARYLLDGTANNAAVYVGQARTRYFSQPAPGNFYSGDAEQVPYIGLLRDYYAWTWGDALFVVIDFYWHSPVAVDNVAGSDNGAKKRDMWDITLGDAQYKWFKQTLEGSKAKYKFIFSHHVLGTGRGGIELTGGYEWGGKNDKGVSEFAAMGPGWDAPIHQLMAQNGVSIFFFCHDHLYVRQELDGVVYQAVPIPADFTYTAFNRDAYKSGVVLPDTGFLNVTVSPANVKVDYISSYLSKDETQTRKDGQLTYSYLL